MKQSTESIKLGEGVASVKFFNADLTNADFSGCNVGGCDFRFAKLHNTIFTNIVNYSNALWPQGSLINTAVGTTTTWDYNNKDNTVKLINGQATWPQGEKPQASTSWSYYPLSQRTATINLQKDNFGFHDFRDKQGFGDRSVKGNDVVYNMPNAQMTRFRTTPGYNLSGINAKQEFNSSLMVVILINSVMMVPMVLI